LKWNGTSAVWYITPSSNKLTTNKSGFARTTPLITILLSGKNPLPNGSCARLIVAGKFLKILFKRLFNQTVLIT